ncbi:double-strand break repair protein AddB [Thermaurantiacus sp.]
MNGSENQGEPGLRLLAIAFGTPFLPALARHLVARHGTGPALARVRVILPSERARRALVEAFLDLVDGRAMLLPRIIAIAQVDEEETLARLLEDGEAPLPPAVPPLARRIALARLLLSDAGGAAAADRLARDLARAVDLLAAHGVAAAQLTELDLAGLASHRARRLAMLEVFVRHWPGVLAERGLMDPIARREALLAGLATRWAERPPDGPVVAAGFATAPPAVARLLAVIARLPQGELILPGLDPDLPEDAWEVIRNAPTHPLFGLSRLLAEMGARPADAEQLGPPAPARAQALLAAFRPAPTRPPLQTPPPGLTASTFPGPETEALAIALAMRQALETPGKTAALVTRSRTLARRVAAALNRWGVRIDDSAGEPLSLRPPGVFLLALLDAAVTRFRPVALLAALKHPLAGATSPEARARWLGFVRRLDLALRGPAPAPGLAGIATRAGEAASWWRTEVAPALAPLEALLSGPVPGFDRLVAALAETAFALAGDRLWSGPDGRALSAFVEALTSVQDSLPVAAEEAPALLRALLDDVPVRPPWRQHPRLAILGPLEARLVHADLLILGDMNEGSWPAPPAPDPWLAPAARRALGLPPAEARIGLEAHDLVAATAAPELFLTRARRNDGGPTVPSRFLLRLEAAFGPLPGHEVAALAGCLDGEGRTLFLARPAPSPPPAERPRRIRVTEVDMLAADPFSFYARHMLGLAELDPLEQPVDAAVKGIAVHRILERLVKERPQDLSALIGEELVRLGGDPALLALWRPRVARMVEWVAGELAQATADGRTPVEVEAKLAIEWQGVRITGKADRIDRLGDGNLAIIDYKTGPKPKAGAFAAGRLRQLPLLRLLVEAGGLPALAGGRVGLLEYWKLSGGNTPGEVIGRSWTLERDRFKQELGELFGRYLFGEAPFVPKLNPVFAKQYRSFDQLARIEEWL